MDENAQLRAEKMLLNSKTMTMSNSASASAFAFLGSAASDERPSSKSDELSLYSTIKNNKKQVVLPSPKSEFGPQAAAYFYDENPANNNFYDDNR